MVRVRRYEGAGRAERGTILDSIAARCAGAARAARAAIEELGDRIWALMRPRKAKTDRVIKREVKSVRKELGALAAEAQQMSKSGKQLESERASGRPESRSKGVDR